MDSVLALREEASLGGMPGPGVYAAGAMIDGAPATYKDATEVKTAAQARRAVDAQCGRGVDFIKTYTRITRSSSRRCSTRPTRSTLKVTAHAWPDRCRDRLEAAGGIDRAHDRYPRSREPSAERRSSTPSIGHRSSADGTPSRRVGRHSTPPTCRGSPRHWLTGKVILVPTPRAARHLQSPGRSRLAAGSRPQVGPRLRDPAVESARHSRPGPAGPMPTTPRFRASRPMQDLFVRDSVSPAE
mgnify:CR=1 FL=1